MRRIVVQEADFDIAAETRFSAGLGLAGISSFTGTSRRPRGRGRITALRLEHYPA